MFMIEPISDRNVEPVVDVHLKAFRGYMNASIGREYVRRFLLWFAGRPDSIAIAAIDDDHVAGYVVGAPVGYDRAMTRDLFWVVARAALRRPSLLFEKRIVKRLLRRAGQLIARRPPSSMPQLPHPVMSLVGIGVSDAARGRGVGNALMREFERRCRVAQMKAIRLSVYADNVPARTLYERAGWTLFRPDGDTNSLYYYRVLESHTGEP